MTGTITYAALYICISGWQQRRYTAHWGRMSSRALVSSSVLSQKYPILQGSWLFDFEMGTTNSEKTSSPTKQRTTLDTATVHRSFEIGVKDILAQKENSAVVCHVFHSCTLYHNSYFDTAPLNPFTQHTELTRLEREPIPNEPTSLHKNITTNPMHRNQYTTGGNSPQK